MPGGGRHLAAKCSHLHLHHLLAALGDVGSSELALTLAHRVRDFPHTDYRPQELSNVVWALGTLGVLCTPTLDAVLAGVSHHGAF